MFVDVQTLIDVDVRAANAGGREPVEAAKRRKNEARGASPGATARKIEET